MEQRSSGAWGGGAGLQPCGTNEACQTESKSEGAGVAVLVNGIRAGYPDPPANVCLPLGKYSRQPTLTLSLLITFTRASRNPKVVYVDIYK